jgi:hypothetical protein
MLIPHAFRTVPHLCLMQIIMWALMRVCECAPCAHPSSPLAPASFFALDPHANSPCFQNCATSVPYANYYVGANASLRVRPMRTPLLTTGRCFLSRV